jgi:hypothetical protein
VIAHRGNICSCRGQERQSYIRRSSSAWGRAALNQPWWKTDWFKPTLARTYFLGPQCLPAPTCSCYAPASLRYTRLHGFGCSWSWLYADPRPDGTGSPSSSHDSESRSGRRLRRQSREATMRLCPQEQWLRNRRCDEKSDGRTQGHKTDSKKYDVHCESPVIESPLRRNNHARPA